ncbi:MAG TPA: fibronectin type III domain-containing protein, partial [Elusimicrobiota bacterium]|nr:fibronectin type III domain-containing protein [Elusimicrobiota bacterium]
MTFFDTPSAIDYAEYRVTSQGSGGGDEYIPWTKIIGPDYGLESSTDPWGVTFNLLHEGQNFVSVRVNDKAGNTKSLSTDIDPFYIKVDTTPPILVVNQTGDDTWRTSNTGIYQATFHDATSGSGLSRFQIRASTSLGAGPYSPDWTDVQTLSSFDHDTDWTLPESLFDALRPGKSHISLRAYDEAGNISSISTDAFHIQKDTSPPVILDAQDGDDSWKRFGGTAYNVHFEDPDSLLTGADYSVRTGPGGTGDPLITDEPLFSSGGIASYETDWTVLFNALNQGTNYVSVRAFNVAGMTSTASDTFYVKKDNIPPSITNNQSPDYTWHNSSGTLYQVEFQDATSLLYSAEYAVHDAPNRTGNVRVPFTPIFTSASLGSHTDPWALAASDFELLSEGVTNYVSVRVTDNASNETYLDDVFFVLKDTSPPTIDDNVSGNNTTFYADPGAIFDVNFYDTGGSLDKAEYRISTSPLQGLPLVKDWTTIALSINATYFTDNWGIQDYDSMPTGKNYISVRTVDRAGSVTEQSDAFYVFKGTDARPLVNNEQEGDYAWRSSSGTLYDVFFATKNYLYALSYFQTAAARSPNLQDLLQDWTTVQSGINAASYDTPWALLKETWDLLPEGTNYISVRVFDTHGSSATAPDAFFVLKDTSLPTVFDYQSGDTSWRRNPGQTYNVDFRDLVSGLATVQYRITADPGGGGTPIIPWTDIASGLGGITLYDVNWPVDFDTLRESVTNYVSVQVFDQAGLSTVTVDAFYIRKDTTPPAITDSQSGDDVWRSANTATYAISFEDLSSGLAKFQLRASTMTGEAGPFSPDWTDAVIAINSPSYPGGWTMTNSFFNALANGATHQISVRAYDAAGSTHVVVDAFHLRKDITPPVITDNESGESPWRDTGPAAGFNVDFEDQESGLETVSYTVHSSAGLPGGEGDILGWTTISAGLSGTTGYMDNWSLDFAALPPGSNHVSVRALNLAGSTTTLADVFIVKKDTTAPTVTNGESGGDTAWRYQLGTAYDVDFEDALSGLATAQYTVSDAPGLSGGEGNIIPWTSFAVDIGTHSYTDDWTVRFSDLPEGSTNYVSVRVWDALLHMTTVQDAFYILKDVTKPTIQNLVLGDDDWRRTAGTLYDVNFLDAGGSLLETAQYTVDHTAGLSTGEGRIIPWTDIFTATRTAEFTQDWAVDFAALSEGTGYVSLRVWDVAGDTKTHVDAFYVKKDTSPPTLTVTQTGDATWRNVNGGSYNVDFADTGGSLLSRFQVKASTVAGGNGPDLIGYTDAALDINSNSYTANWSLPSVVFDALLNQSTNYITVVGFDHAGSSVTRIDAFYVKKDTVPPTITDSQNGDDTWRNAAGTTYSVSSDDTGGSRLSKFQYTADSAPGLLSDEGSLVPWTTAAWNINSDSYATPWSLNFTSLKSSYNWISVRAMDTAGSTSAVTVDAFYVKKDTVPPTDAPSSPSYVGNTQFNVQYSSSDTLSDVKWVKLFYTVQTVAPYTWVQYGSTHTASPIPFTAAGGATYGFRLVARDWAGNLSETDPPNPSTGPECSTIVDLSAPLVDDFQSGDDTWRKTAGTAYNVDFRDPGGLLRGADYTVSRNTGLSGGVGDIVPWTNIFTIPAGTAAYTTNWPVDFDALISTINHVSVRTYDMSGATTVAADVYYIKKDTVAPIISDLQDGATTWRGSEGTLYNVDFADNLSLMNEIQYTVSSSSGLPSGEGDVIPWTTAVSGLSTPSYTSDWSVNFGLLRNGTNYVSVLAYDTAGNFKTESDVFFVRKDTQSPAVIDLQDDVTTYVRSGGTSYAVHFQDNGLSGLDTLEYIVRAGTDPASAVILDWTSIAAGWNQPTYGSDWSLVFDSLGQGDNHVSVRAWDMAGTTATFNNVFKMRKDTVGPTVLNHQSGDTVWRRANTASYDVDLQDTHSGVSQIQTKVMTGALLSGNTIQDWTLVRSTDTPSYSTDWSLLPGTFDLLNEGINYVSVRGVDVCGSTGTPSPDVFFVKKDTTPPGITVNQSGDDTWRKSDPGAVYDVDVDDALSLVSYIQYTVSDSPGLSGGEGNVVPWTTAVGGINSSLYDAPWGIDFTLLGSGTNYVSVRAADVAGNLSTPTPDAFYVKKDTVPPAALQNLAASAGGEGSIGISWSAPGDDGSSNGAVAEYIVKYSTTQYSSQVDFDNAATYSQSWLILDPGQTQNETLTGLLPGTQYFVAIESVDKAGNPSSLSNVSGNSATSGNDTTAPDSIIDLAAYTGDRPGEIQLLWTAPGDNGMTGTASSYVVKYRTGGAITNTAEFNSATTFAQTWEPRPAYEAETQVIDGLVESTTYYFCVKALDEASNPSGLSNSPSAMAATMSEMNGMVTFGQGTSTAPYYRNWSPSTFDTVKAGAGATGTQRWHVLRSNPRNRKEKILGILSSDRRLSVHRYNGNTGEWSDEWNTTVTGDTNAYYRGFDIAYEHGTGRAMVVYANGANTLSYRIWDGSSWIGPASTTTLAGVTAGTFYWVRAQPKSTSDEIMVIALDGTNSDIFAVRWTSAAWANSVRLTQTAPTATYECFDVAWESDSGDCLAVYGYQVGNNANTRIFNGSTWATALSTPVFGGQPRYIRLEADPSSDKIGFASLDSGSDWNLRMWDGNMYDAGPTEDGLVIAPTNGRPMDIAWEKKTSKLVATIADSGNPANTRVSYAYWLSGTWYPGTLATATENTNTSWSGQIDWIQMTSDPNTNNIVLTAVSNANDVRSILWQPGSNNWATIYSTHTTNASDINRQCFAFAYDRHDTLPPTVTNNMAYGSDTVWRSSNTASYDLDFNDTGGSHLDKFQARASTTTAGAGPFQPDWSDIETGLSPNDSYSNAWSVPGSFFDSLPQGQNYVSVRVLDVVGNASDVKTDAFFIRKDTVPPSIPNPLTPADGTVTSTASLTFDWDNAMDETSGILSYSLELSTNAFFTPLFYSSSPVSSQFAPGPLPSGQYYWRVRARDPAVNTSAFSSTFSVTVDTIPPSIAIGNSLLNGDTTWQRIDPGAVYDVDFLDAGYSHLKSARYSVWNSTGQSGTLLISFESGLIADNIGSDTRTEDWAVDYALLQNGTNYVTLRVEDLAGHTTVWVDAFFIRKDNAAPTTINNEPAGSDPVWRLTARPDGYNVDFFDTGGSRLDRIDYTAHTSSALPGGVGDILAWTAVAGPGLNLSSYTANWAVDFEALTSSLSYVSVRAYDLAGSSAVLADAFFVKKDTSGPVVTVGAGLLAGDTTYRNAPGTAYDVNVQDDASRIERIQYAVSSSSGLSGGTGNIIPWTTLAGPGLNQTSSVSDWTVQFSSLTENATNFVSVRAYDMAGNATVSTDTFRIFKDTTAPVITNGEAGGDYEWKNASGTVYNVNFQDSGGSTLDDILYSVRTSSGQQGTQLISWEQGVIFENIHSDVYGTDWPVEFSLLQNGTNYVSVQVRDYAGNISFLNDAFVIRKDTVPPSISDGQVGDSVWRRLPGTNYDVHFQDQGGSRLSRLQYTVDDTPGLPGGVGTVIPWTDIDTPLEADSYESDWSVDFESLSLETTNYVSVRVWDQAGSTTAQTDVFYVLKDTVPPSIDDHQSGDDSVHITDPGAVFDVDFFDTGGSRLDRIEYTVDSSADLPGGTGSILPWTPLELSIGATHYTDLWGVDFESLADGTNYVSVAVFDVAGSSVLSKDVFYVKKDTSAPVIDNHQSGDESWRRMGGTAYDVDFHSNSSQLLQAAQYTVDNAPDLLLGEGAVIPWTNIGVPPLNVTSWESNWTVNFSNLQEGGTNYVSVRTWKTTGATTTLKDAFYILRDVSVPSITDPVPGDDTVWRNSNTGSYNVDFRDTPTNGSLLSRFQVRASTTSGGTGPFSPDWTDTLTSLNTTSYLSEWPLTDEAFASFREGKNYVGAQIYDSAGNTAVLNDVFFVMKDTTPPSLTSHMTGGDTTWRNADTGSYDVDFADAGGSLLSRFQIRSSTAPGGAGTASPDWSDTVTGISSASYSGNWTLAGGQFGLLRPGTNYISVRVQDVAGSVTTDTDTFRILKDTAPPTITDSQNGDTVWRKDPGTTYNVTFEDLLSRLDTVRYTAWTGSAQTGDQVIPYSTLTVSGLDQSAFSSPWAVNFDALAQGINYISVQAWDMAGTTRTLNDVFYIRKDTTPPVIADHIAGGDTTWRRAAGTTYDVDFFDTLSLLATVQYTVSGATALPGGEGDRIPWTSITSPVQVSSYTSNWTLTFSLLHEGTNYVSVRAYDNLGQGTTVQDAFIVLKDTTAPTVTDNNFPDDTVPVTSPDTAYDVDFYDLGGSLLDKVEYTVWTQTGEMGGEILPYTPVALSIGATSYTADWTINYN